MKLKTFEEYEFDNSKDYNDKIDFILGALQEKGIEIEDSDSHYDLYRTKKSVSFIVNDCPFSLSFINGEVSIIIEVDGITDTLGIYDANTELDTVVNIIAKFDIDTYREENK